MVSNASEARRILNAPFFYQAEVLEIAAISADTLLTWHKRGLIPEAAPREGGRGHRRLYSVREAFYLAILKKLADSHFPLSAANSVAGKLVDKVMLLAFQSIGQRIVAFYPPNWVKPVPVSPDCTLASRMQDQKRDFVIFLDLQAFAQQVHQRYFCVLQSRRNSPARRQALAELLDSELQP